MDNLPLDNSVDKESLHSPKLECMIQTPIPPKLVPAASDRDWMDATSEHFAYRCTPLSIANASGWELLAPSGFSVIWTGYNSTNDIIIRMDDPKASQFFISSTFGHGIVTFHPGYIFRTDPGWVVWVRGSPNRIKDGVMPLDGIVETSWLPFSFTMNWKFTRPGSIRFEKDEPFCFITLTPSIAIEAVQPVILPMESDPDFHKESRIWTSERVKFAAALQLRDELTIEEKWQKHYLKGVSPTGNSVAGPDHRIKRQLKCPFSE
ncbi:DUF6065 family protein [Brucella sp. 21LCYQ03]|nr:DUF6065 family protein [Brucella sp. 21LCYQ03]